MVDETDRKIIGILTNNGREHFMGIAKKLSLSESTVRKRVGNLEKKGVIKKYSAVVDPSKMGFGSVALVGVDVVPEKFLQVANSLTEFDNVKFVATSSGDHMIMTEIWHEKSSELRSFISEKIEKIEGVTRTCPAIITERLKEN